MENEMRVSELVARSGGRLSVVSGSDSVSVVSVEYDSRKIVPGSLFVAVKGLVVDGHNFVSKAVELGARAVIVDDSMKDKFPHIKDVTIIAADESRDALSYASAIFYREVSKKIPVVGVTGTNGKTSTTYMLEAIALEAGLTPGVMGTVNYRWKGKEIPAPNTTPESKDIHELMFNMYNDGVDVIFMEVSSHGLHLGRVNDVDFTGAIFTNLTRDHLDYHKTFEEYFSAKLILFTLLERSSRENKFAVINADDEYGRKILSDSTKHSYPFFGYSMERKSDYAPKADSVKASMDGIGYTLDFHGQSADVFMHLAGLFNVYNSIGAFAAAERLGIPIEKIVKGFRDMHTVPGRFDRITSKDGYYVVVDYAHTDDALIKLLSSIKELNPSRIITLFGCGGDRDKTKRPLMGKAAIKYSDHVIVTSDNPRTEDPAMILKDIEAGISEFKSRYEVEPDREKAIEKAIHMAKKGDVIVLAGKGHEDYQIIGKEKIHFDDKEIARKYMEKR